MNLLAHDPVKFRRDGGHRRAAPCVAKLPARRALIAPRQVSVLVIWSAWSLSGAGVSQAWAQEPQEQAESSAQTAHATADEPAPGGEPTAEDILKALQRSRPPNESLQPVGVEPTSPAAARKLLPEGSSIVDRIGRIERRDNGWVFVPVDSSAESEFPLLPNAVLEVAIRTAAGAPQAVTFLVSGEVTVFRGVNYVLLRSARRVNAPLPTPAADAPEAPPSASRADESAAEAPSPPSAEAVLEALRSRKPRFESVAEEASPSDGPTQAATNLLEGLDRRAVERGGRAELRRTLHPDGTLFPRRAGRFIVQGDRWLFVPESDHPDHPEPPLELLPCQATEYMASLWERDAHGLVFIVSGELTLFNGTNYLFPRLAIRQLVSDNLRK